MSLEGDEENNRLRSTFEKVALLYDEVRPGYPEELFENIVELSSIPPEGRILEIGVGTGQATVPFARRGYRVVGIELGHSLASVARRKLAGYPQTEVRVEAFEDCSPEKGSFDVVFSATAFHWLDPDFAYPKVAEALRTDGTLALFWNKHVHSEASRGFFESVQEVYRREVPELAVGWRGPPKEEDVPESAKREIENTNLFGPVKIRKYRWDAIYSTAEYIRLLNTYSDHRHLKYTTRERLFSEIAALIEDSYDGRVVKGYSTILYAARRRRST